MFRGNFLFEYGPQIARPPELCVQHAVIYAANVLATDEETATAGQKFSEHVTGAQQPRRVGRRRPDHGVVVRQIVSRRDIDKRIANRPEVNRIASGRKRGPHSSGRIRIVPLATVHQQHLGCLFQYKVGSRHLVGLDHYLLLL